MTNERDDRSRGIDGTKLQAPLNDSLENSLGTKDAAWGPEIDSIYSNSHFARINHNLTIYRHVKPYIISYIKLRDPVKNRHMSYYFIVCSFSL